MKSKNDMKTPRHPTVIISLAWIIIFALLFLFALFLAGCKTAKTAQTIESTAVITADTTSLTAKTSECRRTDSIFSRTELTFDSLLLTVSRQIDAATPPATTTMKIYNAGIRTAQRAVTKKTAAVSTLDSVSYRTSAATEFKEVKKPPEKERGAQKGTTTVIICLVCVVIILVYYRKTLISR